MDILFFLIDFIIHIDKYISIVLQFFGVWTYIIMFLVVFGETGLVVTPILPGDSLLFALGTFAAKGDLDIVVLLVTLSIAAVLGDAVDYSAGKYIGPKVFRYEDSRFFKKEYLERTHNFYEKHGGKTIIIARFMPIIRTFAPFVAGIGRMGYLRFLSYNIFGGVFWIVSFLLLGYKFGTLPFVQKNFFMIAVVIVFISILPAIIGYIQQKMRG